MAIARTVIPGPSRPSERWSMDFVSDLTWSGRPVGFPEWVGTADRVGMLRKRPQLPPEGDGTGLICPSPERAPPARHAAARRLLGPRFSNVTVSREGRAKAAHPPGRVRERLQLLERVRPRGHIPSVSLEAIAFTAEPHRSR